MATVRDVMKTKLHMVNASATVGEAVSLMAQQRIGSTLVMDGARLIGIFTERDTVRAISQSHDAPSHEISSWMTPNPQTVDPDVDTEDALQMMLDRGFRHLPIVENGQVIGMVSMRDLAG